MLAEAVFLVGHVNSFCVVVLTGHRVSRSVVFHLNCQGEIGTINLPHCLLGAVIPAARKCYTAVSKNTALCAGEGDLSCRKPR